MNEKIIKPYVSKRKRTAQQQAATNMPTKTLKLPPDHDVINLFRTNDVIYHHSLKKTKNSISKSIVKSTNVNDACLPLWSIKWCKKFSHLLACTAGKTLKLFNVIEGQNPKTVFETDPGEGTLKDLDWSRTSRQIVTCSSDKSVNFIDYMSEGSYSLKLKTDEIPNTISWWPEDDNMIVVGCDNSFLTSYDIRSGDKVVEYKSQCGRVLSLDCFKNGESFVATGDAVSEESAQHSIIVWDLATGAKLSDQIFHERYSCPCIRVHPNSNTFLAQTNGNYIARFGTNRPYKLDKYLRYDKHRVDGFPVGFDLSPDGRIVVTGSSNGDVVFYNYANGNVMQRIKLKQTEISPAISVKCHPVLSSMVAVGDWTSKLHILR